MNKSLKSARNCLDQLIDNIDINLPIEQLIERLAIDENQETFPLYAWIPKPVLSLIACAGELGTTSDMSSKCAPSNCQSCRPCTVPKRIEDEVEDNVSDHPFRMSTPEYNVQVNPF